MPDISLTFSIIDNATVTLQKIAKKNDDLHRAFVETSRAANQFNKVFVYSAQATNNLVNKINLAHNQLKPFNNLLYLTGTSAGNLINPLTSATVSMNSFTSALSAANAKMIDFESQSTSVTKPLSTILMNISQPTRTAKLRTPKQPEQPGPTASMISDIMSIFPAEMSGILPYAAAAAAYIGIQTVRKGVQLSKEGIKKIVETTNDLTPAKARLDMIGLSIDEVAQSAIRARTPLFEMTDALNMINTGAGYLFKDKNELVKFTETLNKQMIASGVTPERQKNALVQISQAMSLGVLRGQDFKTVMQDTPAIVKNLADYLGVAQNEVKGLADQGVISAEIFKNAVLSSTAEVDKKLQDMPMTYAQVWTNFKTQVTQALAPFLENLQKSIVESGELNEALTILSNTLIGLAHFADVAFTALRGVFNIAAGLVNIAPSTEERIRQQISGEPNRISKGIGQIFESGEKFVDIFDKKHYLGPNGQEREYAKFVEEFQKENQGKKDRRGYPIVAPTYEEWVSGKQTLESVLEDYSKKFVVDKQKTQQEKDREEIKKLLQTPPPTFNIGRTGRIGSGISRNTGRTARNTDVIARNTKSMEESIKRLVEFNMRTVVERATVNINMPVEQKFTSDLSPTGIKESANDILTKISQALEQSRSITGMQVSY